jgi:hypothetical protein
MLTAAYHMLKRGVEYQDLGADHFVRRHRSKMINRLVKRPSDLGCEVVLAEAAVVRATSGRKTLRGRVSY